MPHERYLALGSSPPDRRAAYRELFRHELDAGLVHDIRNAINGNFALGSSYFAARIAAALGRRASCGASLAGRARLRCRSPGNCSEPKRRQPWRLAD